MRLGITHDGPGFVQLKSGFRSLSPSRSSSTWSAHLREDVHLATTSALPHRPLDGSTCGSLAPMHVGAVDELANGLGALAFRVRYMDREERFRTAFRRWHQHHSSLLSQSGAHSHIVSMSAITQTRSLMMADEILFSGRSISSGRPTSTGPC